MRNTYTIRIQSGKGVRKYYINDQKIMDMIRKEIDERFSFGFHICP